MSYTDKFTKLAGAGMIVTMVSGCVSTPEFTTNEGRVLGGTLGAGLGSIFTDNNAVIAGTGAIGGVLGGAYARQAEEAREEAKARQGSCDQNVRYRNGQVTDTANCNRKTDFPGNIPAPGQHAPVQNAHAYQPPLTPNYNTQTINGYPVVGHYQGSPIVQGRTTQCRVEYTDRKPVFQPSRSHAKFDYCP